MQDLETLEGEVRGQGSDPGDISSWFGHTLDQVGTLCVGLGEHHRNAGLPGDRFCLYGHLRGKHEHQVHLILYKFPEDALGFAVTVALLLTPNRREFARQWIWIAGGIAIALFSAQPDLASAPSFPND